MRRLLVAVSAVLMAVGFARADDAAVKAAMKELDGKYEVKELMKGGKADPAELKKMKGAEIKDGKLTMMTDKDESADFTIDPAQKPAHFDVSPPGADKKLPGIYKFEKGTLTIVITFEGKDRPKDFDGKGEGEGKLVLTKVEAKKDK